MSTESRDPIENSYDTVPYRDQPFEFTHPRQLEAMAVLFGMEPPPIDRCRVLELGCAGGGNLLPMAIDLPESTFLGIDLSRRQLEKGVRISAELGLENIELRHANILDADASWGQFDYIISHGVFSWVPVEVQEKMLAICAENLAPNGVAFFSYNTFPGWHLAQVARDVMCYHASQFNDPHAKIEQAKAILSFLAELGNESNAAGKLLKEELAILERHRNDSYLFHEHLETHNHPLYFHEFAARAQTHGLQYLAEADFYTMLLQNLPAKTHEIFSRLPLLQQEQYMDFVRGRRFRKSLLCRQAVQLQRTISHETMQRFHFSLAGNTEIANVDLSSNQPAEMKREGFWMSAVDRSLKAAMLCLKEAYPGYLSFEQLNAAAQARVASAGGAADQGPGTAAERLMAGLLRAYTVNLLAIAVHPNRCAAKAGPRPTANPLARLQALGDDLVTNQRHQPVPLIGFFRRLLPKLDGQHARADLVPCLYDGIAAGEVTVSHGDMSLNWVDEKAALGVLETSLARLAAAGLLVQ